MNLRPFTLIPFFMLFALLIACGGGEDKTSTAVPSGAAAPDAKTLLANAATATGKLDTFHFKLEHQNGTSPLPLGLDLVSAEGDVNSPDALKAKVKAKASSLNIDVEVVSIGDRTWLTNPFSRKLQELPGTSLKDITDPIALLDILTRQVRDVQLIDSKTIDGADTYHLAGNIDSGALDGVLPSEPGKTVKVDVWVGKADNLPRLAEVSGPINSDENANILRRVTFSKFNEKVEITAPS